MLNDEINVCIYDYVSMSNFLHVFLHLRIQTSYITQIHIRDLIFMDPCIVHPCTN